MGLITQIIQLILDWLSAPINSLDPVLIGGQYFTFLILGMLATVLSVGLAIKRDGYAMLPNMQEKISIFDAVLAGPIEEGVFRGIPMLIAIMFGMPIVPTLFVGTMVWSIMHYKHQDMNTIFAGILFIKLFAGGYWWLAILVHSGHNAFFYLWSEYKDGDMDDSWWCEEREIDGNPYYHISPSLKNIEEEVEEELRENENVVLEDGTEGAAD